jgi:diadenosine tetraphosphatase ApaH/serine/threonine PP2A family protein phosphatase
MRAGEVPMGGHQRATIQALKRRHWEFLESLPLWIDLDEHRVRVVHAGLMPGLPIERQLPRTILYLRSIDDAGAPSEKRGKHLWGLTYEGPPHVVFGHNAQKEPQIHRWATGIDTGCVYGGRLTAMVLREGELPPPVEARASALVSIPARRVYATS